MRIGQSTRSGELVRWCLGQGISERGEDGQLQSIKNIEGKEEIFRVTQGSTRNDVELVLLVGIPILFSTLT